MFEPRKGEFSCRVPTPGLRFISFKATMIFNGRCPFFRGGLCYILRARAEDRATLESDLSAVAGECTEGAGPCALPLISVNLRDSVKR